MIGKIKTYISDFKPSVNPTSPVHKHKTPKKLQETSEKRVEILATKLIELLDTNLTKNVTDEHIVLKQIAEL